MADEDAAALELAEPATQRLYRLYVEMVGRLVENQEVRLVAAQHSERNARLLTTRQTLDLVGLINSEKLLETRNR